MFRSLALGLIRFYQKGISPLTRPTCRFHPTCSAYAHEAIERYGALRGGWIFLKRFARCHPFGGKGYDPVPDIPSRGVRSGPDPATSSPSPGSPPASAHSDPPEARA